MIGWFAEKYGQNPDNIYTFSSFGTVTKFLEAAKRKGEYQDRYSEHEKNMNTPLK
jgi:hypothetical protein